MTWKKWLIRSLICLLLAVLLTGGGLFALWTNPTAIRQLLQEQLGERFVNVSVHVGSARLRLLGGVVVRDLRMARSLGLENQDFLFVPSTVLYHDKEQILDGKVAIRKIVFENPQIRIVRERDGRFNVSGLLGPVNLKERLPTLVIRDGTLVFEDRIARPGAPLLEIKKLQLILLNDPLPTLTLEGTGEIDDLGPVRLRGSITRATMATRLEIDQPAISVNEDLWKHVRMLFPSAGTHLRHLTGQAEANIKLDMPGNDTASASSAMSHEIRLHFRNGQFSHPLAPLALQQIDLEMRLVNGMIPEAKLTASSGETRVDVQLKELQLPTGPIEADLATLHRLVRELDLQVKQLPVTDPLLACLPANLAFIKENFSPSGPVSIRYQYRRPDTAPGSPPGRKEWTIEPRGMHGTYMDFPYPLDDVRGTIWFDTSDGPRVRNIRLDLTGRGGNATAALRGTIRGERKISGIDLRITAQDVSLDDAFMKALPERAQKVARQFLPAASRQYGLTAHPMGKADIVAEFARERGTPRLEKNFTLQIKQASALYDQFPYPLEDVSGRIELHPDHWCCKNFRGRHAGGEIQFEGRSFGTLSAPGVKGALPVSTSAAGQPGTVKITFAGKNLLLDQEFEHALRPISGPDRQGLQSAWRTMRLSGRMNFSAEVIDHANQPQNIEVRVALQGPSMRPAFFNYLLESVSGTVKYARGQVMLTDIRCQHGPTALGVNSGLLQLGAEGGFTAWLTGLTARGLLIDADLVQALPETLRHVLEPIKLKTPVEVATNLTLIHPPGPSRPPEVWWEGALGLDRARFRAGIEVSNATGQLFCKGYHDGHKLRGIHSQLRIARANIFDQPFTNITARLDIEPSANDVLRIRDFQANLFGGTIYGQGRLETGSALKYDLLLDAMGVQLDAFGKHNFPQAAQRAQLQGPVRASVHLIGQGNDLLGLKGNGRIDVTEGKMGQLPVLLDLIKAFGLRMPDRTAFEQAHTVFAIEGPQVLVRQLELVGNAISLNGQGKLDLDGSNIGLDFNATPGRFTQFLPTGIDGIPPFLSGQILKIKMRGKFGKEGKIHFDKELMPGVVDPIKRVFQGAS